MSSHSSEIRMAATENSTAETNGGAKKANGKNYENSASETDLGSVASSVNTSADEEEEEEDISSDHEVQFKSKKPVALPKYATIFNAKLLVCVSKRDLHS